jgi:hypothetical protein
VLAPDQRKVLGSNPSAPKFSLRDGVTGSMSGFELEDEGSTPSPAANLLIAIDGTSIETHREVRNMANKTLFT